MGVAERLRLSGRLSLAVLERMRPDAPLLRGKFALASWQIVEEQTVENTICTVGKNLLAQYIGGIGGSQVTVTPIYGAVGMSATAPTAGDLQLGAESARTTLLSRSASSGVWKWGFLFPVTGGNYSVAEAGVFLAGSATANSGSLLDHALFSISVTSVQTLLLRAQFTLT